MIEYRIERKGKRYIVKEYRVSRGHIRLGYRSAKKATRICKRRNDSLQYCLTCHGFCYWDGDYCCTLKMLILSHIEEGTFRALNPEQIIEPRTCSEYRRSYGRHLELEIETWNRNNDKKFTPD